MTLYCMLNFNRWSQSRFTVSSWRLEAELEDKKAIEEHFGEQFMSILEEEVEALAVDQTRLAFVSLSRKDLLRSVRSGRHQRCMCNCPSSCETTMIFDVTFSVMTYWLPSWFIKINSLSTCVGLHVIDVLSQRAYTYITFHFLLIALIIQRNWLNR